LIHVRLIQSDKDSILVSVRDEGVGLPVGFDPMTSKRLGARIVNALSTQLGAEMTRPKSAVGTNFSLVIPLKAAAAK
jgi:two-component sensor histidine kinase